MSPGRTGPEDDSERRARLRHGTIAAFVAFAAALLLLGGLALATVELEDAVLSYVEGESLWSKAQKEAVIALQEYARSGDPSAWTRYREALRVPLGDRRARRALEREPPDLERARRGFLRGGLEAGEISGMIRLFRWLGDWGPVAESLDHWTAADSLMAELQAEARRLRSLRRSPAPDTAAIGATLERIEALNGELAERERAFTASLDRAGAVARRWSQWSVAGLTALLLVAGGAVAWRIHRLIRDREASVRRSEQRYRNLFEHNVAGVFRSTPDGTLLECNPAFARILGYDSPEEIEGTDVERMYPPGEDRGDYLRRLRAEGRLVNEELRLERRDGSSVWVLENSALTEDPETGRVVNEGTFVDITGRKEAERERRLLSTAVDTMRTGVLITGPELDPPGPEIRYVNEAMTEMTGYREEELLGETPRILQGRETEREVLDRLRERLGAGEPFEGETVNYRKDGTPYHLRWQITPLRGEAGDITHFVSVQEDVTERKRLEERLRHRALHDPMTGLANRTLLQERVEQAVARTRRHGRPMGLLMLDVDHFKRVNDRLGHAAGDRVLTELARRIERAVREEDTAARWGGDEFAVVLPDLARPGDVEEVRERMRSAARAPIEAGGEPVHVDLTVGAVVRGEGDHPRAVDTRDPEELLRFASLALHRAKEEGPGGFSLFDPGADVEGAPQIRREGELREALERGEIVPHYQPIVRLEDRSRVALEALARWRHPDRGLLPPSEFVPLAEDLGLIAELQEAVIRRGCRELAAREARGEGGGSGPAQIAFNVSGQQFRDPSLPEALRDAVEEGDCRPGQVILEVTETSLMRRPGTIDDLREAGFRVMIDDFGTGYSTFSYLRDLEIDGLKIDMTFVQGVTRSELDAALVETMSALGRRLDLPVVAEGVETEEQAEALASLGCDLGQGFLFGRPGPLDGGGGAESE